MTLPLTDRLRRTAGITAGAAFLLAAAIEQGATSSPWFWIIGVPVVLATLAGAVLWLRRRWETWRLRRVVARTDLTTIDTMSGTRFEHRVADLMRHTGYRNVAVVGQRGDGGVDIRAETPDGRPCAVQCKRLRKPVPPNEIRAFQGVLAHTHSGYLGLFVASQGFTAAAEREAGDSMTLVGREELALWIAGYQQPHLPPAT
ncbi:restriction system protein [Haloactinospora alba]|uniref:Restriction system protein n=1 Tax=Haloactinospora alba TaxID=405555 RepID=A0A543NMN5_9ACTN|nr:restriction endonuclease [Haloactinospora alba]TQN33079.1 restriction system protein [Haloactinospora alba]